MHCCLLRYLDSRIGGTGRAQIAGHFVANIVALANLAEFKTRLLKSIVED